MTAISPSRRPLCPDCLRPAPACWCGCVQHVHSDVQLLVLQHPDEVGHAKNTARLLHRCLPHSQLLEGEAWDPTQLHTALHAPWPGQAADAVVHTVLLYPPSPPDPQLPLVAPPPLSPSWLAQPARLRLVLIDGTWRKSRKMLYRNPALQQLPRLPLHDVPAGRYRIRKAHTDGQLSSFEAGALALAQLHGWPLDHPSLHTLWASFDAVIAQHQQLQARHQSSAPAAGNTTPRYANGPR